RLLLRWPLEAVIPAQPEPEPGEREPDPEARLELLDRLEAQPELRHGEVQKEVRLRPPVYPALLGGAVDLELSRVLMVARVASGTDRSDGGAWVELVAVRRGVGRVRSALRQPVVRQIAEQEAEPEARSILEINILRERRRPKKIGGHIDRLE